MATSHLCTARMTEIMTGTYVYTDSRWHGALLARDAGLHEGPQRRLRAKTMPEQRDAESQATPGRELPAVNADARGCSLFVRDREDSNRSSHSKGHDVTSMPQVLLCAMSATVFRHIWGCYQPDRRGRGWGWLVAMPTVSMGCAHVAACAFIFNPTWMDRPPCQQRGVLQVYAMRSRGLHVILIIPEACPVHAYLAL